MKGERTVLGRIKISPKRGYGNQLSFHIPSKLRKEMNLQAGDYLVIIRDSNLPTTEIILQHRREEIEYISHELKV